MTRSPAKTLETLTSTPSTARDEAPAKAPSHQLRLAVVPQMDRDSVRRPVIIACTVGDRVDLVPVFCEPGELGKLRKAIYDQTGAWPAEGEDYLDALEETVSARFRSHYRIERVRHRNLRVLRSILEEALAERRESLRGRGQVLDFRPRRAG